MLAHHLLETSAAAHSDKIALVCGEQRLTYRKLNASANRLAHALREAGVKRGDRVTILLESSPEAVISIFGALKAGAVFMALHPGVKPEKLALLMADAEPSVLITDVARVRDGADVLAGAPSLRCLVWADNQPLQISSPARNLKWSDLTNFPEADPPRNELIDVDLATLVYTSGSTGTPKGVVSSHANMIAVTNSINAYLQNTPDDVILNVLPLAFGYGLYQLMLAFQVGARVVLEKTFAFPARTLTAIEQEGITALPGVPTLYALLLRYPNLLRRELPSLRYMTNAAAAMPTNHIEQIRAAFPHVRFFSMYGQTECARISYLPPEQLDNRPSSVGIAIPNTEVYIAGEDGRPLPPGEVGELVVRGSHVARGYWRAPELTEQRFRPGPTPGEKVLYTGDLFRMDEEGFLYFVSRMDDIIKVGGEKVSPREVEETVCRLEGVSEAAVVPVADPVLGQAVRLLVVPHAGVELTERQVRLHCAGKLDDYMLPKYVEIVAELPRTENGKVNKQLIKTT